MAGSEERQAHPRIDLETVRETLAYMHDDMERVPGLVCVRQALGRAIAEIRALEGTPRKPGSGPMRLPGPDAARFVPWTPEG